MPMTTQTQKETEQPNEIDATLRHISRMLPDDYARALLPGVSGIRAAQWLETQIDTPRKRRLDRTLDVHCEEDRRLLHTEWQLEMRVDVPFRVFEYHNVMVMALVGEHRPRDEPAPPNESPIQVESTVVLLTGREAPWPAYGEYRTSPKGAPFSGVRFRIDAVYQRTVAELEARQSALWLVFAPLCVDADEAQILRILEKLRAELPARLFEELALAMSVMADVDQRKRGLRPVITSRVNEEGIMQNWLYQEGHQQGRKEGRKEGLDEGRLEEARAALRRVLARRELALSPRQQKRINDCTDLARLERWHDQAVTAKSTADALK